MRKHYIYVMRAPMYRASAAIDYKYFFQFGDISKVSKWPNK